MLLRVNNVSKAFSGDTVFKGVTFDITARQKVALVGRNGVGKTTLIKILLGQMEPDSGQIELARNVKIGYLAQMTPVQSGRTVLEEAESALASFLELEERLAELEKKMEAAGADEEDLAEYARLSEHVTEAREDQAGMSATEMLKQLGFNEHQFDQLTDSLSGGQRTRLAMARLLIEQPDLLILDEPTNHLDVDAAQWLEGWIRHSPVTVLLISHDRVFLENTVDHVLELREESLDSYRGNFEHYLRQRAENDERKAKVAEQQQQQIDRLDAYVRRFMNSQRTAQARGRLKQMEKLKAQQVLTPKKEKSMVTRFGAVERSGELVYEAQGLSIGFPGRELTHNLDWTVTWKDRWAIVGANGTGKSTLMKVITGQLEPLAGKSRVGSGVQIGMFTQDGVHLPEDMTPLDYITRAMDWESQVARDWLGRFLITADQVLWPIRILSGGERNKLALAELIAKKPNLLILDEPTNHLDMDSRAALAMVLDDYEGTLLLVSHDRWLLRHATDSTLELRNNGFEIYPGGFEDFEQARLKRKLETEPEIFKSSSSAPKLQPTVPRTEPVLSPRELSKAITQTRQEVAEAESEVQRLEEALAQLENELNGTLTPNEAIALSARYDETQREVDRAINHWEKVTSRYEDLLSQRGD